MLQRAVCGVMLAIGLLAGSHALPQGEVARVGHPHVPGEVIIKFREGASRLARDRVFLELGAEPIARLKSIRADRGKLTELSVAEAIARVANHPAIEYIEPNYLLHAATTPSDPLFGQQWGLENVGQTGGTAGADIKATAAWDVTTDARDIVIAVIDSGVNYVHEDLSANIFVNPGETPSNNVDDDGNGFVDDVFGWDFFFGDNTPLDDNGHGSHVAGTLGAVGDNGIGVAGIAWRVKILPLKFLGIDGSGSTGAAVDAIDYAVNIGADIINASFGGSGGGLALAEAVQRAEDAGVFIVAAAGNGSIPTNIDASPFFPASYPNNNIITVAASDHDDDLWGFSNYGPVSVDLAAPGVNILSTWIGNEYAFLNGTSQAAPLVSGTLALMLQRFPDISVGDARELLLSNVDRQPTMTGLIATGGRLNAFLPVSDPDETPPAAVSDLRTTAENSSRIDLLWTAPGDDGIEGTASRYDIRYSTDPLDEDNFVFGTRVDSIPDPAPSGQPEMTRVTDLAAGTTYYFGLRAFDEFGNRSGLSNVVAGTTLGPPVISIDPESLSAQLFTGQIEHRTIRLQNDGEGEYLFESRARRLVGEDSATKSRSAPRPRRSSGAIGVLPERVDDDSRGAVSYGPEATRAIGVGSGELSAAGDPSGGLRVLILHSDANVTEIRDELAAFPDLGTIDTFDGRIEPPPFEQLTTYDSIVIVVNRPFEDLERVGDMLADYVDQGGGLVVTLATFIEGWQLGGRVIEEGYLPFNTGSGPIGGSTLASFDMEHPIFNGVESVTGELLGNITVRPGATEVGTWANGQPMAAVNDRNVVGLNLYIAGSGFWLGDAPLVLHNSIHFSSTAVTWVSTEPESGVVPAGESLEIDVVFDSGGLIGGTFEAGVILSGNDPVRPSIVIPVTLEVVGASDIFVAPATLEFGQLFVGQSKVVEVAVTNLGTSPLLVQSASFNGPGFSASPSSFSVPTSGTQVVEVTWTPTGSGPIQASLNILSNDPDEGLIVVSMNGESLFAPEIEVTPASLSDQLVSGETSSQVMTIHNDGGSDLVVEMMVQSLIPSAQATIRPLGRPQIAAAEIGTLPDLEPADHGNDPTRPRPIDGATTSPLQPAAPLPLPFVEGFEDGDFDGWGETISQNLKEVVDTTAANGTFFSYHQFNNQAGHFNGIFQILDGASPEYMGFWIRSGSAETNDAYFIVRDQNLNEAIFFFAGEDGTFYCNLDTGGDASVPYEPNTWHFIEFRNIDLDDSTFDYWVDEELIKAEIRFRYGETTHEFSRLELYNFDRDSEAWWDEIVLAAEPPSQLVRIAPTEAVIPAGETLDVEVKFDSRGLDAGDHFSNIVIESNDPDEPIVLVPAHLNIIGAPDIDIVGGDPDFGIVFLGTAGTGSVRVGNEGTDTLLVTGTSFDLADFFAPGGGFLLEPGSFHDIPLKFTPTSVGEQIATLTLFSNDPDEPQKQVEVRGNGQPPPAIRLDPTSLQAQMFTGQKLQRSMTLSNDGGSDLLYTVDVQEAEVAPLKRDALSPRTPLGPQEFPPAALRDAGATSAASGPLKGELTFLDGFEDGDFVEWNQITLSEDREVTDLTAADLTTFSYHDFDVAGGHFNGIFRGLPLFQPTYASFWIRSGGTTTADSYVAIRGADGAEAIFFFTTSQGRLYVNADVGGNDDVLYEALTWYHIEFRDIDFDRKEFDYWVNGELIQEDISFRNTSAIQNFGRIDLYNFTPNSEAWWDEILLSTARPAEPVLVAPETGIVPPGESRELTVHLDATGLGGGRHPYAGTFLSNDPFSPEARLDVELFVDDAPDILLSTGRLTFESVFVGAGETRDFRVINIGTLPLTVDSLTTGHPDFTIEDPAGFVLQPGGRKDVQVTYRPSSVGSRTAALTVASDDPDQPTVALELHGIGVAPPVIVLDPGFFDEMLYSGETVERPLVISNTGDNDLNFRILFLDGVKPDWFTISDTSGRVLPGGRRTLTVAFSAEELGTTRFETVLTVTSNDPLRPEIPLPVAMAVESAPVIVLDPEEIDFGPVFVGTTAELSVSISNIGFEQLRLTDLQVEPDEFGVVESSLDVAPGETGLLTVTFTPAVSAELSGTLTATTNVPGLPLLSIPVTGRAQRPPELRYAPDSFSEQLLSGEVVRRTLKLSNLADGLLEYDIDVSGSVDMAGPTSQSAEKVAAPVPIRPQDSLGAIVPIGPAPTATAASGDPGIFLFHDGFEDGEYDDTWSQVPTDALREVTAATAGDDTGLSFHEAQSAPGHIDGLFQDLPQLRPGYISFWVRSGAAVTNDGFVVLRDGAGREVIWFYCTDQGVFYMNADVGGDATFRYEAGRWYHVEFKNINFATQTFDYFIDSKRIRRFAQFRNFGGIDEISRIDLYNFDEFAEAWWDEITFATEAPFRAVRVRPAAGEVPGEESLNLDVIIDSRLVLDGEYEATIELNSNDPAQGQVEIPVMLNVTGVPDIGISSTEVDFGVVLIEAPEEMSVTVTNFGTKTLEIPFIGVEGDGFSANTSSLQLAPDKSHGIAVRYEATAAGDFSGLMTIQSNDPNRPVLTVDLRAQGVLPPRVRVDPESITVDLLEGQAVTREVIVENFGGEPLTYSITAREPTGVPVQPQATYFMDDVEGPTDDWSTEELEGIDLWHVTQRNSFSPDSSFWCGDEFSGHYGFDTRVSAALVTPAIDLTDREAPVTLRFMENYDTEPTWDQCLVDISIDDGNSWIPLRGEYGEAPSGNSNGWIITNLALDDYIGQEVRIRFYFETFDGANNHSPGWFVDDITLIARGQPWVLVLPEEGIVPAGESRQVSLLFDATEFRPTGDYDATIEFETNDPFLPLTGVAAHMKVGGAPELFLVDGDLLDFGEVAVGSQAALPLRIENVGVSNLIVDSIATDEAEIFVMPSAVIVPPGGISTIRIDWLPSTASTLSLPLRILSNDPARPITTVALAGEATGVPGRAEITPDAVTAALPPDDDRIKTKYVALKNVGEGALDWSATQASFAAALPLGGTLAPGEEVAIEVSFSSAGLDAGEHLSSMTLTTSDPDRPTIEVPLTLHASLVELRTFEVDPSPKYATRPGTVEVSFPGPEGYDPRQLDVSTVSLHGVPAEAAPVVFQDLDRDGVPEIILQFDAAALAAALPADRQVEVRLEGEIRDRTWFEGMRAMRGAAHVGGERSP